MTLKEAKRLNNMYGQREWGTLTSAEQSEWRRAAAIILEDIKAGMPEPIRHSGDYYQ